MPFGRGPFTSSDLLALNRILKVMASYRPRLVHGFNAKPMLMSAAVARASKKTEVVSSVTGMGNSFMMGYAVRTTSRGLHSLLLGRNAAVIFENPDDCERFLGRGWVVEGQCEVILGTGVDTQDFVPMWGKQTDCTILMLSRLVEGKGIREFIHAAQQVRAVYPDVRFILAGEAQQDHPRALPDEVVREAVREGAIEFLGHLGDVRETLRRATVFVLPSYYPEGIPRVLQEAAASGVPIVTTDHPGCREAVIHGETGLLVEPKNPQELATSILRLIDRPEERVAMGEAARSLAVRYFDIGSITEQYFQIYRRIGFDL
jgi:glycosyltransferase involved in cell wall biosynthesis